MYIHTHADKLSSSCVFVLYDVYIVYRYKFTPFHTISIIYLHHASMSWLTVTVDYQSLYHCAWIINPLCFHLHSLTQLFPSSGKSRAWRLVDERHDLTVPIAWYLTIIALGTWAIFVTSNVITAWYCSYLSECDKIIPVNGLKIHCSHVFNKFLLRIITSSLYKRL